MSNNRSFGASTGGGAGAVASVNGHTGTVVLTASDVSALAVANNLSDLGSASTARTNLGLGDSATKNTGTSAGTVAAGDDSRITGAAQKSSNLSDLGSASTARTNLGLGDSATKNTGTSAGTVAAGDDSRFTALSLSSIRIFAKKTADESVTSSTTLQDDNHLIAAVEANTSYLVELHVIYNGSTSGDIKLGWSGPSGATLDWSALAAVPLTTSPNDATLDVTAKAIGDTSSAAAFGTGTNTVAKVTGLLIVSSTAGNLTFKWAQDTSNGTATTVKTNSYLLLRKLP